MVEVDFEISNEEEAHKISFQKIKNSYKGETFEIQWKAEPSESEFGTMVTVEFSRDGRKSWEKVKENVSNSGKYVWDVPKVGSTM